MVLGRRVARLYVAARGARWSVLGTIGVGSIVRGVSLWSHAAAWLTLGAFLLLAAFFGKYDLVTNGGR